MKEVDFWVNFLANLLTIIASGIATYVYFKSSDKIAEMVGFIGTQTCLT